ncbi:glycosyltransferase family 1 protein [Maritimibacter sp. DP1N21-5]|uniref:glycosyltransferase family 4 protein n=1 Tax=Maritimibacter sp. DP1N21-5 TaxID=2836867 RepID=UPI001C473DD7|nr:glycosyltransferase family 1 protein [Maritimibacter sp. DP1N21-5]MBV7411040.1 glycosyltransferase family 4 protein [Maritimibacter sp. DP1N21-5]
MSAASARLLDLSRLVSRAGKGRHTGIDRVEGAYLSRLLTEDTPLFALVRSSLGYTLYDRAGVEAFAARLLHGADWGRPDFLSPFMIRASRDRRRVLADLRRLAIGWSRDRGLARMIGKSLAPGYVWIAVGHSDLRAETMQAVKNTGGRIAVMIHDTIPIDRPEVQTEASVKRFRGIVKRVAQSADLVIHTADATRALTERWFAKSGRVPEGITAHLGIVPPPVDEGALSPDLRNIRDYFVVLGTLEPRKNVAMLLEVWAELSNRLSDDRMPVLVIVGAMGWLRDHEKARIAAGQDHVIHAGPLADGAVGALLSRARALLMPSVTEGFGLPPGEALALGCPVILSELQVFREVFGNNPVYLTPSDLYSWAAEIQALTEQEGRKTVENVQLPTWEDHFKTVLRSL